MDSIFTLLQNKDFDQPEITAIKDYVRNKFKSDIGITIHAKGIVLSVPSPALASSLRFDLPNIKRAANTDKRISIRIGN